MGVSPCNAFWWRCQQCTRSLLFITPQSKQAADKTVVRQQAHLDQLLLQGRLAAQQALQVCNLRLQLAALLLLLLAQSRQPLRLLERRLLVSRPSGAALLGQVPQAPQPVPLCLQLLHSRSAALHFAHSLCQVSNQPLPLLLQLPQLCLQLPVLLSEAVQSCRRGSSLRLGSSLCSLLLGCQAGAGRLRPRRLCLLPAGNSSVTLRCSCCTGLLSGSLGSQRLLHGHNRRLVLPLRCLRRCRQVCRLLLSCRQVSIQAVHLKAECLRLPLHTDLNCLQV